VTVAFKCRFFCHLGAGSIRFEGVDPCRVHAGRQSGRWQREVILHRVHQQDEAVKGAIMTAPRGNQLLKIPLQVSAHLSDVVWMTVAEPARARKPRQAKTVVRGPQLFVQSGDP
jgi:hypothetical protein